MSSFAGVSGNHLKQFIERMENLEEQKNAILADIREILAEAKSAGFDTKAIRQIVKMRKMDQDDLKEQEEILNTYLQALQMGNNH